MRPIYLTTFIGRDGILSEIQNLVTNSRLITITGPGGVGKTRLAAELFGRLPNQILQNTHWVDIAPIRDETLIPQEIANILSVRSQSGQTIEQTLVDALNEKTVWLLLDNCEHLLEACANLVNNLLKQCPQLSIIATSREPFGIVGERHWPLPPLSLPEPNVALESSEAVTLFLDRAKSLVPQFALTPGNSPVVVHICRQLDALPLAIELAAVKVSILSVEQIAERLDNRFALLQSDERVVMDRRYQTLRMAIDWSFDLLTQPEQLMLQRLSIFASGCSLDEVEIVCAGDGIEREELLNLLASLVNKSLATAVTFQRSEARYYLLETIRQYGQEKLRAAGDWSRLRDRHLHCFLQSTAEIETRLQNQDQQQWLNLLEEQNANIRTAISWSLESDQIVKGLQIANALYQFWTIRDYAEEGLSWLERLLVRVDDQMTAVVKAKALCYAVLLAEFRGNHKAQSAFGHEAASLAELIGETDKDALRWLLAARSFLARKAGDTQKAYSLARRQIQLHRELEDTYQLSLALSTTSFTAMSLGKFDEARAMLDEGLPLLRQTGNPYRLAMALNFYGDLARCEQNYQEAQSVYEESIALLREIDAVRDLASALHNLGHTSLHLGDVERAADLFKESLALHQEQGNRPGMTECLLGFAALAVVSGLTGVGATLLAVAETIGGPHVTSEWAATSMEYEYYQNLASADLSEMAFRSAQMAGGKLSLEKAVVMAEGVLQKTADARQTRQQLDQLTPREREVVTLIAQAKTNDDIAADMVISKRTVETHITRIRSKLDFTERAQIVRWAITAGLVRIDDQIYL